MRSKIVLIFFVLVWIVLLTRLYYLSIKSNRYYEALAEQNVVKKEWIAPIRGEIFDRNHIPLAINHIGFKIKLAPHLKRESLEKIVTKLQHFFPKLNRQKIIRRYKKKNSLYNHDFIDVVRFVDYQEGIKAFTPLSLDNKIAIEPTFKRYYPQSEVAAHVLGYVSKANEKDSQDIVAKITGMIGKNGIEKFYNSYLEGEPGYKKIKVTAFNEEIGVIEQKEPKQNRDLILTLDMRLQRFIHSLFKDIAGVAIVMKTDGEILAAGSFPEFDPNLFVGGINRKKWQELITDLNHPFTNKLVSGLYPPGSTIKMGVGLAFLDSRKISEYTPFFCNGAIKLGRRKFRCWNIYGHGDVRLKKAIRESCDVYFYEGSLRVGIDKIAKELRKMGLGKKSGIDLPYEFIGVIPDKEWKERKYGMPWYKGETVVSAIGQGYDLVTPMQIARYTALLASGKLPTPHFAKYFKKRAYKKKIVDVLTLREKRGLKVIRQGMWEVCHHPKGTATHHITTSIDIAGKTGTAQIIGIPQDEKKRMKESELAYYTRSHAWLTTFAPYKSPKYVVTVLVEHGGHGGSAAGPIVSKIYEKMKELGYFH